MDAGVHERMVGLVGKRCCMEVWRCGVSCMTFISLPQSNRLKVSPTPFSIKLTTTEPPSTSTSLHLQPPIISSPILSQIPMDVRPHANGFWFPPLSSAPGFESILQFVASIILIKMQQLKAIRSAPTSIRYLHPSQD